MLGLTATPYRRDNLGKLVFLTLGDRTHKVDPDELREDGAVLSPDVVRRETSFSFFYQDDYQEMLTALVEDQERNEQIADDVIQRAAGDRDTCLVVSDRVQHCETLAAMLRDRGAEVRTLTGQTPRKQREQIVEEVQGGQVNVLVSTLQLLGEGFDCSGLSALFLATPVKFKGRVLQVVGRILRPADGKRPVVFDYVDSKIGVLKAQAKSRGKALAEVAA
jgi:superfamily II DNA or RNA helicase